LISGKLLKPKNYYIYCQVSSVGTRFSAPVQTGPGAHPASYTMDTGSFPAVKRLGWGVDHTKQSSADVKEKVQLFLYSPYGHSWPVI